MSKVKECIYLSKFNTVDYSDVCPICGSAFVKSDMLYINKGKKHSCLKCLCCKSDYIPIRVTWMS